MILSSFGSTFHRSGASSAIPRRVFPPRTLCHTESVSAFPQELEPPRMSGQPNPEFLRRAIALATRNVLTATGGPFAAVVVRDGKIVGEGANSVTATNDPTAHAEVNAIRAAAKSLGTFSLAGCVLYTSCEPCPMCLSAAYWARLDAVYYGASAADAARAGFDDALLYAELRKDPNQRKLQATQLLADEAWASFAAWIAAPNKVEY
jgi:tRNA(Arg) A34 adenosine deaminase TadA